MNSLLEDESTLTDKYQTTIPSSVRKALHLKKRDRIHYFIQKDGSVLLTKDEKSDPVLGAFLSFIAKDIENSPQNTAPFNKRLYHRIQALVSNVEFDLDLPLREEDE